MIGVQKEQALIVEKMRYLFDKKEELTLKEFKKTLNILCGELGLNKSHTFSQGILKVRDKDEKIAMSGIV